jgi:parallel beta-helix repeat protein
MAGVEKIPRQMQPSNPTIQGQFPSVKVKRMKRRLLASMLVLVLVITGLPMIVEADTNVTSNITVNTTWTTAGSPYVIKNDIRISTGVTLTINPGVTVKFDDGYDLTVYGALVADGTYDKPITFTSSSGSPSYSSWDRIYFPATSNNGSCVIDNCIFDYADRGIYADQVGLEITNCSFGFCYYGTFLALSDSNLLNITYEDMAECGLYSNNCDFTARKIYVNNSNNGVDVGNNKGVLQDLEIRNCTNGVVPRYTASFYFYNLSIYDCQSGLACWYTNTRVFFDGLYIENCNWNSLYGFTGYLKNANITWCSNGLELYYGTNFLIENIHFYETSNADLYCYEQASHKVHNMTSTNIIRAKNQDIYVTAWSSIITVYDSVLTNSMASWEIRLDNDKKIRLVNTTYDKAEFFFNNNEAMVIVMEYIDLTVKNATSSGVEGAKYWVMDHMGNVTGVGVTDANGKGSNAAFVDKYITNLAETPADDRYTVQALYDTGYFVERGSNSTTVYKLKSVNVTMGTASDVIVWNSDHILTTNEYYNDVSIIARGYVNSTGFNLGFDNVTLMFDHYLDGVKGINFMNNARFNATNSTVTSIGISELGINTYRFYLYLSRLELLNCTVGHQYIEGIFLSRSQGMINDTLIVADQYYGVRVDQSRAEFDNCTFEGAQSALLYIQSSSVVHMLNCSLQFGYSGMRVYSSNLYMDGCDFNNITQSAIVGSGHKTMINDTYFTDYRRAFEFWGSDTSIKVRDSYLEDCVWETIMLSSGVEDFYFYNSTIVKAWSSYIVWLDSADAWFINSTLVNTGPSNEIYLTSTSTLRMMDSTYNYNRIYFDDETSKIVNMTYCDIRVIDDVGKGVPGATFSVEDAFENENKVGLSNATGMYEYVPITLEISYKSSKSDGNPHTFSALNYSGTSVWSGENVTTVSKGQLVNITILLDPTMIYWSGDHVLTSNEFYKDKKILACGNVTIPSPFWLAFDNVTLMMNYHIDDAKGIEVQDGGRFNCSNSSITSIGINGEGKKTKYYFQVGSSTGASLRLNGTGVDGMWDNGIYVQRSTDITVTNSSITDNDRGLYLRFSKAFIFNNTFKGNYYGIYLNNCDNITINWSVFQSNFFAIFIEYCEDIDVNNCFFNTSSRGIYTHMSIRCEYSWNLLMDIGQYGLELQNCRVYSHHNNFTRTGSWDSNIYCRNGANLVSRWDRFYEGDYAISGYSWDSLNPTKVQIFDAVIEKVFYPFNFWSPNYMIYGRNITITSCDSASRFDNGDSFFDNMTVDDNDGWIMEIEGSHEAYFRNSTFYSPNFFDHTIWVQNAKVSFMNCTLQNSMAGPNVTYITSSGQVKYYNCSVDRYDIYTESGSKAEIFWYYDVYVRDNLGNPMEGMNVTSTDNTLKVHNLKKSDVNGNAYCMVAKQYEITTAGISEIYNPHNVTADDLGAWAWNVTSITGWKIVNITIYDTYDPITNLYIGNPKYRALATDWWNVTTTTTFTLVASDFFSGVSTTYYQFDSGGWNTYSVPLTMGAGPSEGWHKLEYYSDDKASNVETVNTEWVYLDKSSPIPTLAIGTPKFRANAIDNYNVTSATPFTLSASDQSGIADMFYKIDSGSWNVYTAAFDLSSQPQGPHRIYYNAIDQVGINGTGLVYEEVVLDDVGPVMNITFEGPYYRALPTDAMNITTATKIHLSAFDLYSGVETMYYDIDGAGYVAYTGPISLTTLAEGLHTFDCYADDNVTNTGVVLSMDLWVDQTKPLTNISIGDPKYRLGPTDAYNISGATQITLIGTDDHSGINLTSYKIDNGASNNYTGPFTISVPYGFHTISFRSRDMMGNLEVWNDYEIHFDDIPPVTDILVGDPKYRETATNPWNVTVDTEFTLNASDLGAGVEYSEYRIGGSSSAWNTYIGPFTLVGRAQGLHLIEFRSHDWIGNQEGIKSITVALDKFGPIADLTLEGPTYRASDTDIWNITVATNVILSADDSFSGVGKIMYRLDLSPYKAYTEKFNLANESQGLHMIDFYPLDNLDNQGTVTSVQIYLVKDGPVVTIVVKGPKFVSGNLTYVGAAATLEVTASARTGIKTKQYKLDDNANADYTAEVAVADLAVGEHTLKAWATENLDLRSEDVLVQFYLDDVPPSTLMTVDVTPVGTSFTSAPTFTLVSTDADSGIKATYYKLDGAADWSIYTGPIKVETKGSHTLEYYAEDNVGNTESVTKYTFSYVDKIVTFLEVDPIEPLYNYADIEVSGKGSLGHTVEIYLNDAFMDSLNLETTEDFTFEVRLLEGENRIKLKLLDKTRKMVNESKELVTVLDSTPPAVEQTTPEEDQEDVPVNIRVIIIFDEDINHTLTILTVSSADSEVSGEISYLQSSFRLMLKPDDYLEIETIYHVYLQVFDFAGNELVHEFDFTTSTEIDPDDDVEPGIDEDGDGMDDDWEREYFGDLSENAAGDYDNDNFTNLEEYKAQTDPTDPLDHPVVADDDDDTDDDSGLGGAAGIALLIVLLIIIIIVIIVIVLVIMRRRKPEGEGEEEEEAKVKSKAEKEEEEEAPDSLDVIEAIEAEVAVDDIFKEKEISVATGVKPKDRKKGKAKPMVSDIESMDAGMPKGDIDSWDLDGLDAGGPSEPKTKISLEVSSIDELLGDDEDPYAKIIPSASGGGPPTLALPPAEVFEAQFKNIPKVDEIFVVTQDGILLRHFSYMDTTLVDEDILSSMLTVIQNFIQDSFGKKGALKQLRLGEFNILISQGEELNVVAISTEADLDSLEKPIEKMITEIEEINKDVLPNWDGNPENLHGIEDSVTKLVNGEY